MAVAAAGFGRADGGWAARRLAGARGLLRERAQFGARALDPMGAGDDGGGGVLRPDPTAAVLPVAVVCGAVRRTGGDRRAAGLDLALHPAVGADVLHPAQRGR